MPMDKKLLENCLKMIGSENDVDAVMGLRGAQNMFKESGASLESALRYAADHLGQLGAADKTISSQPAQKSASPAAPSAVNVSGVPECRMPQMGVIEIVLAGKTQGDAYQLPGAAAQQSEAIALGLKDALIAAVVNKSRLKLKLLDIKSGGGDIVETILQAEFERPGMTPIRIWANGRGEVGALAAVLRKAIATTLPELAG
jgi:hypothetical protein